jgi:exonuclease SbcC
MKILAIRLKNLASIEALDVDFTAEPLRSAGIFAISGPTGSGKSTILDALCLALYDKTPRFVATAENVALNDVDGGKINQADVKNILRRGTSEGYAEADFRGIDGNMYRSRWMVRRARNKANGSMQAQTMTVRNLTDGSEFQGTKREVLAQLVTAIGLTYEQFTRTVLLAKIDFATFLKSKDADKAELLEKLTGTEIYSRISSEVYRRSKQAKEELQQLSDRMAQISVMTAEEVAELRRSMAETDAAHKAEQEHWRQLNKQQNVVKQYSARVAAQRSKQEELNRCKTASEAAAKEQQSCSESLTALRQQLESLRPELLKAREQDVRIQSLLNGNAQLYSQLQAGEKQLPEARKACEQLRTERTRCCASLEELTGGRDAAGLMEEYVTELNTQQKSRDEVWSRLEAINIKEVSDSKTMLTSRRDALRQASVALDELVGLNESHAKLQAELTRLDSELHTQQTLLDSVSRLYENAQMAVSKNVESLRNELAEGMACPVCGSTDHPYAAHAEVVETLYNSIKRQYDDAKRHVDAVIVGRAKLGKDIEYNRTQTAERIRLLNAYGEEERTAAFFNASIAAVDEQLKSVEAVEQQHQQLSRNLQQCDNALASTRHRIELLRKAMENHRLSEQKFVSATEKLDIMQKSVADARNRYTQSSAEIEALRNERAKLLGGKSADEVERGATRRERELTTALDKAREAVGREGARLSGIVGELKQMEEEIAALKSDYAAIEHPESLDAAIGECLRRGTELGKSLIAMGSSLTTQQKAEEQLRTYTAELTERRKVAEGWSKLNDCIGSADGKAFKVIAQSYTLKLLLLHANKHLAILSRRYKLLQVPDTLALQVIDRDMCDEVRTVYSLSGGESFLISLALALGLSSLSGNGLKVESLFIDEGFGSLDSESLRIAMEALEMLQNQGRKIGVISHVQEMSERIAVQIRLRRVGNGKSEADSGK